MAQNISKTYRIDIQLDAARQQLADTSKKLAELDASLDGLDRNSDQAKGIIAQMAELAAQVDRAEGEVGGLTSALDDLKPGSIPALEAEIEELEAAFRRTTVGTAEFDAALLALGKKKGELKSIEDAIDALDPKEKAAAFADFANGVVGAFAIATTAAQTFGLSKEAAEEYQNKLLGLMAVMDGVEQVSRALSSETLSVVKSSWAAAKGYLGMGEAAATGSRAARVALAATGIGLVVVLLGTLYSLWQDFGTTVRSSESNFTKWKGTVMGSLGAALSVVKDFLKFAWQLTTLDFSAAQKTAAEAGTKAGQAFTNGRAAVIDEARRKELAHEVTKNKLMVDVLKARGQDTLALEVAIAKQNLEAQKKGSKEALEALRDYTVLRIQLQKRAQDDEQASRLVFLNGLAAAEAARGADSFKQQLAAKKQQIADLNQAEKEGEYVSQAQRLALDNELQVLLLARAKELAERRAALQAATLNAELARLQARGRDGLTLIQSQAQEEIALAQRVNAQKQQIAAQNLKTLRSQALVDGAAVVAAESELATLRIEAEQLAGQKRIAAIQAQGALLAKAREAILASAERREQQHQDTLNQAQAAGARITKRIADELAADLQLKAMRLAAQEDVGGRLLIKLFGLTDEQAQDAKKRINDFVAQAGNLINNLMSIATAEVDQRLSETQAQLQLVSEQLSAAQAAADATAGQLEQASGARREYLIEKLQRQRAEEERLASVKARAARAEAEAEREKQKLTKETTQLTLAAGLASTVATGAKSVEAAVNIITGATQVQPFPAALIAVVTGLAVVGTALAQARALGKSLGDGGIIEGGSHASGNDVPVQGGKYRVEGGEAITPVDATANNGPALELIRTKGRKRRLTAADFAEIAGVQVLPPPGGAYAAGGVLGQRGAVAGPGQVVVAAADLSELVNTNYAMLDRLDKLAASNQQIADFGPANLRIGPEEALKIEEEKGKAQQAQGFATL
jgi:hypothetical protein